MTFGFWTEKDGIEIERRMERRRTIRNDVIGSWILFENGCLSTPLGLSDFATIVVEANPGFSYKQCSVANSRSLGSKMNLSDQQDD